MSDSAQIQVQGKGRITKDVIVTTAVLLFNRHGYDRTSMNDIAVALGITKAALYHHFVGKEEILIDGINRASDIIDRKLQERGNPAEASSDRVRNFIHAYGRALRDPMFCCFVLTDERVLGADGRQILHNCKRRNQRQLERLLEDAGVSADRVRGTALAIFGALNWCARAFGDHMDAEIASVMGVLSPLYAPENADRVKP